MYLGDFKAFLQRNKTPHSLLTVLTMGQEPFDVITIFDENKYLRHRRNHKLGWGHGSDFIETGKSYQDLMRIGFLVNIGLWAGNWVPEFGGEGVHDDEKGEWIERPTRGWRQGVEHLVIEGVLCPNIEVMSMMPLEEDRIDPYKPTFKKRSQFPEYVRLYADLPK